MSCYNGKMDASIARQLIELNHRFYSEFGPQFSATRQRIQPGVRKIIATLAGQERILDLGCGNGELARTLAQSGFHGEYLGLDFSLPLLNDAGSQPGTFQANFRTLDLSAEDWPTLPKNWSLVMSFATLHHIPSSKLRLNLLQKVATLLAPGGRFIHSNWQFLNSEKLRARIQPWERANLSAAEVDEGDYLLDWRSGGAGLRYAHHYSETELASLATETGFRVVESFLSDGENGRLGLYQVWEPV